MSQRRKSQKQRILEYIIARGESTELEVRKALGMKHASCSARVNDLKKEGWLVNSGRKKRVGKSLVTVYVPGAGAPVAKERVKPWERVTAKQLADGLPDLSLRISRAGFVITEVEYVGNKPMNFAGVIEWSARQILRKKRG